MFVGTDGLVPKERYTTREFLDLEYERLWSRVWQVACREEELTDTGDYLEYTIGDQSILVVRVAPSQVKAYYNCCLHRGTRLAEGTGHFAGGEMRCRYHAWCYDLDGRLTKVVDEEEFTGLPAGLHLPEVRCESWGGFVFVNLDRDAVPLLDYLAPLPKLLAPFRLERLRFRSYRTTVLPANWKAVIDAFNEGYHVQGTHPQLLPWTDDVSIQYEQFETHSHYGRLANARRQLRPSPRLGLKDGEFDEGEILASLVAGLGGLFYGDEQKLVDELRSQPLPAGRTLLEAYQERRRELLTARGIDISELDNEQLTSADDVYWFPNMVGPIYPGSAILFRVRPNGSDPDSSIKDSWILEWPKPEVPWRMCERRYYPNWRDRDWGVITNQDYENMAHVQQGMKARGFQGLRLNPRQESNVLHMHRVIDRYIKG